MWWLVEDNPQVLQVLSDSRNYLRKFIFWFFIYLLTLQIYQWNVTNTWQIDSFSWKKCQLASVYEMFYVNIYVVQNQRMNDSLCYRFLWKAVLDTYLKHRIRQKTVNQFEQIGLAIKVEYSVRIDLVKRFRYVQNQCSTNASSIQSWLYSLRELERLSKI